MLFLIHILGGQVRVLINDIKKIENAIYKLLF